MGKFDTHGGYFSPQGYLKVNTGGSHEENPNGGVQLGVDGQGIPNMLEEGEPVYNDFVYSDNIKANKEQLKKYNIPEKYAGKLYSEIADKFVDEAKQRPNDPISNNGLNAMLLRLANAQEEQKQIKQQKEIEDELSQLSPEEMAELESLLAQPQSDAEAPQQEMVQAPEQMMMPMSGGGPLGRSYVAPRDNTRTALNTEVDVVPVPVFEYDPYANGRYSFPDNKIVLDDGTEVTMLTGTGPLIGRGKIIQGARAAGKALRTLGALGAVDAAARGVGAALKTWRSPFKGQPEYEEAPELDFGDWDYANGGKINKFEGGGWSDFINSLNNYKISRNPGRTKGSYQIDTAFPLGGFGNIKELEASDPYRRFTNYVLHNSDNEDVLNYLRALDAGTPDSVQKLFDGDNLREGWQDLYKSRRTDGKGGIYHFIGDDLNLIDDLIAAPLGKSITSVNRPNGVFDAVRVASNRPVANDTSLGTGFAGREGVQDQDVQVSGVGQTPAPLPTWPRYAGAINSAITGLYDVFQEPDRYTLPHYTPVLPSGTMDLIDPTFNPLDENQVVNDVLASGTSTARALQNSGLGPSVGATLLAADYNTGRNIGNARAQVWDANNQRRNQIIAQRNANAQALGNFNYGISRDRANILNMAALQNMRNDLTLQQLNYDAEAQKYAAIQNQLDAVSQALAGIGRENYAMNQINSDTAYDYVVLPDGRTAYVPKGNNS